MGLTIDVINDFKQAHHHRDTEVEATTTNESSTSTKPTTASMPWGARRQRELIEKCIQSTIDSICLKYHSNASDLLESVRKMEDNLRMLQRVRRTNVTSSTSAAANSVSDDDKIRIQLHLDVVEFGRLCAEKFNGYRGESNYDALLKLVEDARSNLSSSSSAAGNSSVMSSASGSAIASSLTLPKNGQVMTSLSVNGGDVNQTSSSVDGQSNSSEIV